MYSSACFEREDQSLEDAQRNKLERVCRGLELAPDDHLLEIGTGWGGLAVHAAREHGCRVTTTTISREQRDYAEARVRAAGLEDLVTVIGADYRDLVGRFDKLVSIEMIEAVGWQYFDLFFRRCSQLLEPHGLMLLQAICADDRTYEAEKATRSFASRLIFPGGCLPSVGAHGPLPRCGDRHANCLARGHLPQLRAHPAGLARSLSRRRATVGRARLRPPLPAPLGAVLLDLGGGIPGGADHGRADALRQAWVARTRAGPDAAAARRPRAGRLRAGSRNLRRLFTYLLDGELVGAGDDVDYNVYPGVDHGGIVSAADADALHFFEQRAPTG